MVNPLADGGPVPLSRVARDRGAAVLLVNLRTSTVVYANDEAVSMAGDLVLPMPVDDWGSRVGLTDSGGAELAGSLEPLSRIACGEPVAGALVRRDPARSGTGQGNAAEALWVTGFPLALCAQDLLQGQDQAPERGADARAHSALVVLRRLTTSASAGDEPSRALHDRAVLATDLSFSISDPRQADNPLVWVNPAFVRRTGYSEEQVLGRNCRFLQGEGTDPAALQRIREALHEGRSVVETLLNYHADGTTFWNEVSISPVLDTDGQLVNFVGVQADVTRRIDAEAQHEAAYAAERRARSRLALLSDVGAAVLELEVPVALRRLAHVLARDLLEWCVVVVSDADLRLAAAAGVAEPDDLSPFPLPRPGAAWAGDLVAEMLAGNGSRLIDLDREAPYPETSVSRWVVDQVWAATPGPCLVVPIPGHRTVLGLLVVGLRDGILDDDDAALVRESARRVGLALDTARLYAREHLVAETLQRSMLPVQSSVPGLDVWSYYAPNLDHAQVGGDWYDVMQPDADSVGIVIGDVVGHDIEAAASMGQLRSVVRAYAFEQEEPGTVLMRVDQLVHGMRIPRAASLVYARLTQLGGGRWEMAWSRAGHLPPLLVSRGVVHTLSENGGTLVGIGDRPRATNIREIGPGDVVVFYTDGLIERRSRPMMDGLKALQDVCASLEPSDAAGIGEQLLAALGDAPEDDMAIVVMRVPSERSSEVGSSLPRQRRWQLPGEPTSIGRARRLTVQTAALWDLDVAPEAELVVSELVANAVLHGWGPVGLRLQHGPRGLLIEVEDANPTPPARTEEAREGPGGYGLHVVRRLAEWGWHASGVGKTVWARITGPTHDGAGPSDAGPSNAGS